MLGGLVHFNVTCPSSRDWFFFDRWYHYITNYGGSQGAGGGGLGVWYHWYRLIMTPSLPTFRFFIRYPIWDTMVRHLVLIYRNFYPFFISINNNSPLPLYSYMYCVVPSSQEDLCLSLYARHVVGCSSWSFFNISLSTKRHNNSIQRPLSCK